MGRESRSEPGTAIQCIETGQVFISIGEASKALKVHRKSLKKAVEEGWKAAGFHWRKYEASATASDDNGFLGDA
eukprot:g21448.t1